MAAFSKHKTGSLVCSRCGLTDHYLVRPRGSFVCKNNHPPIRMTWYPAGGRR